MNLKDRKNHSCPETEERYRSAAHKHHAKSIQNPMLKTSLPNRAVTITHEAIARLAYSYWEARGRQADPPNRTGSALRPNYLNLRRTANTRP